MKIRQRFAISNIIMLVTPIILMGVISAAFLVIFVMKYPVEQMYITRAALLNPRVLSRAIGDFFQKNPGAVYYIFIWLAICIAVMVISTTLTTRYLSRSIEKPITELKNAADNIRNGNLDFEVMGSVYDEIDSLCSGFDSMRRELKRAAEKEAYMKTERSMLLTNISHDLKTPVTSIKGYIEGIRDGIADTPEKQKKYLDTVYAKAVIIDDMVNNLSVYSKLELSKLPFEFTTGDINIFLRDLLEDYRLDLEKNGMELEIDIPDVPAVVKIDYEKMGHVFSNLIGNAIKYKSGGSGLLRVSSRIEDGGVYITAADNGIGISPDELNNVFEGFYRVDAARNMNIKGSGLGLGIVKQIAEKHGGKIWLKSEGLGSGTQAILYLPLAQTQ